MSSDDIRPIPSCDGYFASSSGDIYSSRRTSTLRKLNGKMDKFGRVLVSVKFGGKFCWKLAHRLVLEAFVGPCPDGMECRHLNGNPSDNRVENLAWGTHRENMHDKFAHGTTRPGEQHWTRFKPERIARGERSGQRVLSEAQVVEIIKSPLACKELARIYGVTAGSIGRIKRGLEWAHVKVDERVVPCSAKLDASKAAEIRARAASGEKFASLSRAYGVGWTTISRVVRGDSWNGQDGRSTRHKRERAA